MDREEYPQALDLFQKATDKIDEIASRTSLDCKDDLRSTLSNQYIDRSMIESDKKKLELVMKRLKALGVKSVESESWILNEMESN